MITEVISVALYLTDKGEHPLLYKLIMYTLKP